MYLLVIILIILFITTLVISIILTILGGIQAKAFKRQYKKYQLWQQNLPKNFMDIQLPTVQIKHKMQPSEYCYEYILDVVFFHEIKLVSAKKDFFQPLNQLTLFLDKRYLSLFKDPLLAKSVKTNLYATNYRLIGYSEHNNSWIINFTDVIHVWPTLIKEKYYYQFGLLIKLKNQENKIIFLDNFRSAFKIIVLFNNWKQIHANVL